MLVCLVSTRWIVVANAAIIATATTVAKTTKAICVRRRLLQLRSLFMGNTFYNMNQRNPWEPVPLLSRLLPILSRLRFARGQGRRIQPQTYMRCHRQP
jgi:cation transporter-like permease